MKEEIRILKIRLEMLEDRVNSIQVTPVNPIVNSSYCGLPGQIYIEPESIFIKSPDYEEFE